MGALQLWSVIAARVLQNQGLFSWYRALLTLAAQPGTRGKAGFIPLLPCSWCRCH